MTKVNKLAGMGQIKSIRLDKLRIPSRHAQREKINDARVNKLHANFDLDKFGLPTVSERPDGEFYIMDGQHRIEALKLWLGEGWEAQHIDCRVYRELTEAQEAEMFLSMNDALAVGAFDKFRVAVHAGRSTEVAINDIVHSENLVISRDKIEGSIRAVGTLRQIYTRSDGRTLAKTLRIVRDSFGDAGLEAMVLNGIGHLCQRYNGTLEEDRAVERLSKVRGGVAGLLGKAEVLHKQTGNMKAHCVAAAAVDIINAARGGKKLPGWWAMQE